MAVWVGFLIIILVLVLNQYKVIDMSKVSPNFKWATDGQVASRAAQWDKAIDQLVADAKVKEEMGTVNRLNQLKEAIVTGDRKAVEEASARVERIGGIPGALGKEINGHAKAVPGRVFESDNVVRVARIFMTFFIIATIGAVILGHRVGRFIAGFPIVFANLGEVIDGCVAFIKDDSITDERLMKMVKAPDFPTGGIIYGYDGVKNAYTTGRGRIVARAKATIETGKNDRQSIIVTEIPYQVNKSGLIERIAGLVREDKIDQIADMRDASDQRGMSIVIELKRGAQPKKVLNQLYKYTALQSTYGVQMVALVTDESGRSEPRTLTLKRDVADFH